MKQAIDINKIVNESEIQRKRGRPSSTDSLERVQQIIELRKNKVPVSKIAEALKVTPVTVYYYLKKIDESNGSIIKKQSLTIVELAKRVEEAKEAYQKYSKLLQEELKKL